MKKGFTIVELLMVIGIIGVLLGIVTTAASGAVKNSRARRREALCALVQTGIATYHAQNAKWPVWNGNPPTSRDNKEGSNRSNDPNKIVLTGKEVRECVYELAMETKRGQPVMDVSGLFVSRDQGRYGSKASGLDFMSAIRGTRASSRKMRLDEMYFGYPDESTGKFRHFKIVYSIPADAMTVSKMDDDSIKATSYE